MLFFQASLFGSPSASNGGSVSSIPSPRCSPVSQPPPVSKPPDPNNASQLPAPPRGLQPSISGPRPGANIRQVPQSIINEMIRRGIPVTSETVAQVLHEIQSKAANASRSQIQATPTTTNDPKPPLYTPAQISDMINRRQPIPPHIIRDIMSRGLPVTSTTIASFANAAHMSAVPKVSQVGIPPTLVGTSQATAVTVPQSIDQNQPMLQGPSTEVKVESSVPNTDSANTVGTVRKEPVADDQKPSELRHV